MGASGSDDLGWLASDGAGQVAAFFAPQGGWAPREVHEEPAAHEEAIDALAAASPGVAGLDEWERLAAGGVYVYLWEPAAGVYRRVCLPPRPTVLRQLSASARQLAWRLSFARVSFAQRETLTPVDLRPPP